MCMVLNKHVISIGLVFFAFASCLAGADHTLEQFVWDLEDMSTLNEDEREDIFSSMHSLDPDCTRTCAVLNRFHSIDETRFKELLSLLGHDDYYKRSFGANMILTFSFQDIRDMLTDAETASVNPEELYQLQKILYELENNYYVYKNKIRRIRNNLIRYLVHRDDMRVLIYAPLVFASWDESDKEFILKVMGRLKSELKNPLLCSIFPEADRKLQYYIFSQIREYFDSDEQVQDIIAGVIRDNTFPLFLRSMAASLYSLHKKNVKTEFSTQDWGDRYVHGILQRKIKPELRVSFDAVPSSPYKMNRYDHIIDLSGTLSASSIGGITMQGDVLYYAEGKKDSVPVFTLEKIQMTPTGKRENRDYICRIIFKNTDSLSGNLIEIKGNTLTIENSYTAGIITFDSSHVAGIQFNTENKQPEAPGVNSLVVPEVTMVKGDTLTGTVFKRKGRKLGIRLEHFKVYSDSGQKELDTVLIDSRDIDMIYFPCTGLEHAEGFCKITTLYGDNLTGNLVEMDSMNVRLYSSYLGLITLKRDKIRELEFDCGLSVFREYRVIAFSPENTVRIYDRNGNTVWERTGLDEPVYAEMISNGDILICEKGEGKVSIYSREGVLKDEYRGYHNISTAHELKNSNLLINCYRYGDNLFEINRKGETVQVFRNNAYITDAVKRDDGTVIAIARRTNQVFEISSSGEKALIKELFSPSSIQLLENGNILIAFRKGIKEYTPEWKEVFSFRGVFNNPRCFSKGRYIFLLDKAVFLKLDLEGNVIQRDTLPTGGSSLFMY